MQSNGISDCLEQGGDVLKMHFQVDSCVSMVQHSIGRAKMKNEVFWKRVIDSLNLYIFANFISLHRNGRRLGTGSLN